MNHGSRKDELEQLHPKGVAAYFFYVREEQSSPVRGAMGVLAAGAQTVCEDDAVCDLNVNWSGVSGAKFSLIQTLQRLPFHFSHRDAAKHSFHDAWHTPAPVLDFAQHQTLPVGPTEEGNYGYARSRLGVTVLAVYAWSAGSAKVDTYCRYWRLYEIIMYRCCRFAD